MIQQHSASPDHPGEQVDLIEAGEVSRANVSDVSLIDDPGREEARRDPLAEHTAGVGVDVVVVGGHRNGCTS